LSPGNRNRQMHRPEQRYNLDLPMVVFAKNTVMGGDGDVIDGRERRAT